MAELCSAIFWVLCPEQSLHCYIDKSMDSSVMFKGLFFKATSAVAISSVLVASLGSQANAQSVIRADGSSTVFPIMERAASDFQKSGGSRVTVGVSGTGGGFKKFCNGDTDISNASRPITKKEIDAC
jgi:phosphate transport system substrate-binding protein